jgi:Rrf2 family cysteine metabolism transcriptional repressor
VHASGGWIRSGQEDQTAGTAAAAEGIPPSVSTFCDWALAEGVVSVIISYCSYRRTGVKRMRFSTKTRYGARAMAELAAAYGRGAVSVKDIAESQCVSPKYLEQIMASLKAAGLVEAARGTHGGYQLSRPPETVCLADVFRVLEGTPAPVACVETPGSCAMEEVCPTRETWVEVKDAVQGVLEKTTLRELGERQKRKRRTAGPMYYI